MKRLRVARDADTDVLEIWTYYFERSQSAAERIVREITAEYDNLYALPCIGRRREDIGPEYRSFPVGDYIIYYRVLEDVVEIARVLHGGREVSEIFPSDVGSQE